MQLRNYLLIIGTAIGAGIFALPGVAKSIGSTPFLFLLLIMALVTGCINYCYYRVSESVKEKHQLTGYARIILGKKAAGIAALLQIGGLTGAMTAFLVLGTQYTMNLFLLPQPVALFMFWLFIAIPFLFLGANLELFDYMAITIKLVLFGVLAGVGVYFLRTTPHIQPIASPSLVTGAIAYGAVLFSMASFSIVPEMKKTPSKLWFTLFIAQATLIILYYIFSVGFAPFISPNGVIMVNGWVGRMLEGAGIVAVYTPFMLFLWVGKDLLTKDLDFTGKEAKGALLMLPLAIVLIGVAQFDVLIAVTGGIFLSAIGIMIVELYKAKFPGKHGFMTFLLQAALLLGIVSVVIKLVL